MARKQDIRLQAITARKELSDSDWQIYTDHITATLAKLPCFREAFEIYCYVDFNNEVGTLGIIKEAWRLGKQVAVPKVNGNRIDFYYITSMDDLAEGTWGILEPVTEEIADGSDGLVIMPGAAFDRMRNRIGYGRGYYDRYLYNHPQLKTAAIAFDMQITADFEPDEHDIRPDIIITEKEIID